MKRLFLPALLATLALGACHKPAKPSAADADKAKAQATAFMADNAKKPGVQTIEPGVEYQVVHSGPASGSSPGPHDIAKVMYEGKLTSGTVFDSSFERGTPATFPVDQVVPGFASALQKMRPGDEWTVWIAPDKGYGFEDNGPIPAGSVLVFRVQLLDFLPQTGLG